MIGEDYSITVATNPANGPFIVNDEIEFTCYVDPTPSELVTYSWHAVKEAYGATMLPSSALNTTRYIPRYSDLHESWFFCKAFLNGAQIGAGRKLVRINGTKN